MRENGKGLEFVVPGVCYRRRMQRRVRQIGLLKLIVGAAAFVAGFWFVLTGGDKAWFSNHYRGPVAWAVAAALPGVLGLVGLLELVSGVSMRELATRWDALPGWYRWPLAIVVIVAAVILTAAVFLGLAYRRII